MDTQKIILVLIIIVLFAALGFELKTIEDMLSGAALPADERCSNLCSQKGEVPYLSGNSCFCKEPVSFSKQWRCFSNVTFENDSLLSPKLNATAVRDIAIKSVVKYPAPNAPATKIFGIYNAVSNAIYYVSDPRKDEYVADPMETWNSGGGDCDDFSVLLSSMYEAVGLDASMVEVYNVSFGHVFVIVRIEQDLDSFLKAYRTILEKNTQYFSEKPFNFIVFASNENECESIDKSLEAGQNINTFYIVVESTTNDYPGSTDAFNGYEGRRFIKAGF